MNAEDAKDKCGNEKQCASKNLIAKKANKAADSSGKNEEETNSEEPGREDTDHEKPNASL